MYAAETMCLDSRRKAKLQVFESEIIVRIYGPIKFSVECIEDKISGNK